MSHKILEYTPADHDDKAGTPQATQSKDLPRGWHCLIDHDGVLIYGYRLGSKSDWEVFRKAPPKEFAQKQVSLEFATFILHLVMGALRLPRYLFPKACHRVGVVLSQLKDPRGILYFI